MTSDIIPVNQDNQSLWDMPIEKLLAGQIALSSLDRYRRDIKAYIQFAHDNQIKPMEVKTLASWRDHLIKQTELSPNTISRMLSAVKRFVHEASKPERGLIPASLWMEFKNVDGPSQRALKTRTKKNARTRIEADDMRKLCESPDPSRLIGLRDRALLATMASSGCRASEIASLMQEQVVRRGRGYFLRICGKTDIDYRDAHLSIEAHMLMREWLEARQGSSPYIFTSFEGRGKRLTDEAMSETSVWRTVQKYAKKCDMAHIKPHDFRRFVGTTLAARDIRKAQLALGHKRIETTAKHYILDQLEAGETDNLY